MIATGADAFKKIFIRFVSYVFVFPSFFRGVCLFDGRDEHLTPFLNAL